MKGNLNRIERVATSRDGVMIHFETCGKGPLALVFVHGWSCDRRYWNKQMNDFARKHQVIALDLAGHGESGFGRKDWTLKAFGEDVVAVAKTLQLEKVVLIGHSMGGDVIVEAARQLQDMVMGLVWVDTYRTLGNPRSGEQVERFLAPFRADFAQTTNKLVREMFLPDADKILVDWVAADMSAGGDVALKILEVNLNTFEHQVTKSLAELNMPIVSINPDYRPVDVEELQRHGVRVIPMHGVGHFPMLEKPVVFNRLLRSAIDELSES